MALPQNDQKVQDALQNSWVDTMAPVALRPYLRLSRFDRPVGAWLLFLPCVFGAALAGVMADATILEFAHFVLVCFIGAWLMRGAGCTWNDIADRHIDAQVERTKSRPLPSGSVSVFMASVWMAAQMVISLMALVTLNTDTIVLAIVSLAIVAVYPFAKRFTYWPQIVLGFAFNWGVLIAFQQLADGIYLPALALYGAMIFWTLYYDTIYAFQDIRDDEQIGVKSTARALQDNPLRYLGLFAGATYLSMTLAVILVYPNVTLGVFVVLLFGAFLFLAGMIYQLRNFDAGDPERCLRQFRENVSIGQVVAVIWIIGFLA